MNLFGGRGGGERGREGGRGMEGGREGGREGGGGRERTIDGSTDRCCIAIVTNERVLLSGSVQPVQNLGRHRILCM